VAIDVLYDIDINAQNVHLEPLVLHLPGKASENNISRTDICSFARTCHPMSTAEFSLLPKDIDVVELKAYRAEGGKMKCQLWLRLSLGLRKLSSLSMII
jgi:hypothetical protein